MMVKEHSASDSLVSNQKPTFTAPRKNPLQIRGIALDHFLQGLHGDLEPNLIMEHLAESGRSARSI